MAKNLSRHSRIEVSSLPVGQLISWDTAGSDTLVDTTDFDTTGYREQTSLGLLDGDLNVEVHYDNADVGQLAIESALGGGSTVTAVVYPEGKTTGKPLITYILVIGSSGVSAPGVDDAIKATFSAKIQSKTKGTVT